MLAYLESFVDRYGLREHIEFNAEVVNCRPLDERWD
jgi:cation diffusion facilitator CzcD-associated flavoprotein CzcO